MSLPSIAILGIPFDTITTDDLSDFVRKAVETGLPHYMVIVDENLAIQARDDESLRRSLIDANLTIGAGKPVLRACRMLGTPPPDMISGEKFVGALLNVAVKKKLRVAMLSDSTIDSDRFAIGLRKRWPELILTGVMQIKSEPQAGGNISEVREKLGSLRPDFLFVTLPSPAQEQWIAAHYRQLNVPLVIGAGATPVRMAGVSWNRKSSGALRRGWRRLRFAGAVLFQRWRLRMRSGKPAHAQFSTPVKVEETWQWIKLPERLDLQAVRDDVLLLDQVLADGRHCLLEMTNVKFIDSTGVGLLIRLQKKVQATGRQLVLLSPSAEVRRALSLMRLTNFFASADDMDSVRHQYPDDFAGPHAGDGRIQS